ncbi:MAG: hypothetical protein RMM51_03065 [Verrucomicrobiae bacterium]|nr:hypothetical protein [Verrucomicrobiae bacterium]
MRRPIAIYTSYNIRYPLGGHVLAELHYIVGLQRLGYDVYVVEEAGSWPTPCFDPEREVMTDDPSAGIAALRKVLAPFGLAENWCYIGADGRTWGLSRTRVGELCRQAAMLFSRANVTWIEEFAECPLRVFVDTDPGFTQFRMTPQPSRSTSGYASPWDFHVHFTYGERIGSADCPIPTHGLRWWPTRPPVVPELVPVRWTPHAADFTTVMSWRSRAPVEYRGETYGQKDVELRRFMELPRRCGPIFELAIAGRDVPWEELRAAGWKVRPAIGVTRTMPDYLRYIGDSRGEWSVAVNLEVKTRSGWFSDRSAAYLAAGKPVIAQDTGFSEVLPCGRGLWAFRTVEEAVAAVEAVQQDYAGQCAAAREVMHEFFHYERVLRAVLERCNLPVMVPASSS